MVTVHGLDAFFARQVRGYAGELCGRVADFVYRSAGRVICVSERVRKGVENHPGIRARATVIYNGVDSKLFYPATGELSTNTILSVGNLIPTKGHELLMRAIATLRKCDLRVRWEIIGDGPERQRLEQLGRELEVDGQVYFLGRQSRSQVAEAMRRCTLFALPSYYEGLGCVYLEAMCSGKTVIGCRGQGIDELVQHAVNGWLIGPGDLEELTESLATLLQKGGMRRRLGEAARKTILQSYTLDHQAAQLSALYRECLL